MQAIENIILGNSLVIKEMKKLTGKRYHIRRRGRGIRKGWGECYRSYLPLNKSNYMAVYIVGVK